MKKLKKLATDLIELFQSPDYKAMSKKELAHRLCVEKEELDEVLNPMLEREFIFFKRGRYETAAKKKKKEKIIGKISVHSKGFGFVTVVEPKNFGSDVFIPPPFILGAVEGDTVEIKLHEKDPPSAKGPEGEVIKIVKRRQNRLVGTIYKILPKKHALVYVPLLGTSKTVIVKKSPSRKYAVGDRLLLGVVKWPKDKHSDLECKFVSHLGTIFDPEIDHQVAAIEFDIPTNFSEKTKKEAKAFGKAIKNQDYKNRKDYTKLETFTIDPKTAKDYDDALSLVIDEEGRIHLYVHVADVSHYVEEGSMLDEEAVLRGNTTYFPGHAFPMLPEELSNELCSLKEGVARLTATVHMIFNKSGELQHHSFEKGVIKSAKRFTYEEAKEVLDQKIPSKHYKTLKNLENLYHLLKKHKLERGCVDLSTDENVLKIDSHGVPTDVYVVQYDITHKIIEECMLKANELVAKELRKRLSPAIYRVHEKPDSENLAEFYRFANSLHLKLPEEPTIADIQKLFQEVEGTNLQKRLTTQYIRSMKLAAYSDEPIGHFGLALTDYTHFTSPIRRYVDLIVHRQLFDPSYRPHVKFIATNCSETERRSFKAENSVLNLKKLRYLKKLQESKSYEEFDATITKVRANGLIFDLNFLSFEGFIHIASLEKEYFHYSDRAACFVGENSKKKLYVGMAIKVKIEYVDLLFQECRWKIVEY